MNRRLLHLLSVVFVFFCLNSTANNAEVACVYANKVAGEMAEASDCGELSPSGEFVVADAVLREIDFPEAMPACLLLRHDNTYQAFYVIRGGKSRATLFFDNGCDYFKNGLARTHVNNKAAYFDTSLDIKITTDFEQGLPFYYEHAVVCNGPFIEKQHGEHKLREGGQCGLINLAGNLVVPAVYPIQEQDAFNTYINSNNECEPPPINSEDDALCHGRRHARHLEYHSDDWGWYQVRQDGNSWYIDFAQKSEPDTQLTMELGRESAQWLSIIPK